MVRLTAPAGLVAAALLATACSASSFQPGTEAAPRIVEISAHDSFAFDPGTIEVRGGETVRFVVSNQGELEHEFVIGTREALLEHAGTMTHGGMQADTATAIRLIPGQTKDLVYTFDTGTDIEFGCLVPGHFPAGMAGRFVVTE